jgi:hypothetical protein
MVESHTKLEIDMIDTIMDKLGVKQGWLVDVGANDGSFQSSTRHLLDAGWNALMIEADKDLFYKLTSNTRAYKKCKVSCKRVVYLSESLDFFGVPDDLDLLHIDIDGQDFWVWAACSYRPKVVSIEYNSNFDPGERAVVPLDPEFKWEGDTFYGASATAFYELGLKKGYTLVGQTPFSQLFFVRDDLAKSFGALDPKDIPKERIHPLTQKQFLCGR